MESEPHRTDRRGSGFYDGTRSAVETAFRLTDRVANRLFGSDFNPFYKSGTIAILLLSLVTVTGLILVFFYRLSEPYESVHWISERHLLLGWLRGVHRYASGATVVAVVLHAFRMFAQGKSWGPRAFSWITGLLLLFFLFVSGWTGYVLVWDQHALALVTAGARMLDATGLLADPLSRSFNGSVDQPPGSFFFLNLFLHVVVPLGMIFATWVHTSKMARASWFPPRKILLGLLGLFGLLAVIFPAPLAEKAEMLSLPTDFPADWFFSFFIPFSVGSPGGTFLAWLAVFLFLGSLPFWLSPRRKSPLAAHNEERRCIGCSQCAVDCPYEAISMATRTDGSSISKEMAIVSEALCVSCGLCAGSCPPMTIGVPGRKGGDHYAEAKDFVASVARRNGDNKKVNIVIGCLNQPGVLHRLQRGIEKRGLPAVVFTSECMGTLHMGVVEYLAQHFNRLFLAACPERNCSNKDAHFLLRERLEGRREPHLLGRVSRDRIVLVPTGDGEEEAVLSALEKAAGTSSGSGGWVRDLVPLTLGFAFLLGLSRLSGAYMELDSSHSTLRLSWRLTGQLSEVCRDRSPEELVKLPAHMRTPRVCERTMTDYVLRVSRNGEMLIEEEIRAGGLRRDRPLYVDRDVIVPDGEALIEISFTPLIEGGFKRFLFQKIVRFQKGKIALVHFTGDQTELVLKEAP